MIILSKLADYGVIVATHLAAHADRQATATAIASSKLLLAAVNESEILPVRAQSRHARAHHRFLSRRAELGKKGLCAAQQQNTR